MRYLLILALVMLAGCSVSKPPEPVVPFALSRTTPAVLTSDKGTFALGYKSAADTQWTLLPGSVVEIQRGTRLGFRPTDGGVEAIVGSGAFPVRGIPATATDVAWLRVYNLPHAATDGPAFNVAVDDVKIQRESRDGKKREGVGMPSFD